MNEDSVLSLTKQPLSVALAIAGELLRNADFQVQAATQLLDRIRGDADEQEVKKILSLLATDCSPHPSITQQVCTCYLIIFICKLIQMLDCMLYPKLLIEYMPQLVGDTEEEIAGVIRSYLSTLSSDSSLLVGNSFY